MYRPGQYIDPVMEMVRLILLEVFGGDGGPLVLGFEEEVAELADGAAAAGSRRDVVGRRSCLVDGVRHRNGEADAFQYGHVDEVIAHIAYLFGLDAEPPLYVFERHKLVCEALVSARHFEVLGAVLDYTGFLGGDYDGLYACPVKERDAKSVLDVEELHLIAVYAVDDSSVGHNPVDVEDQELDALSPFYYILIDHCYMLYLLDYDYAKSSIAKP